MQLQFYSNTKYVSILEPYYIQDLKGNVYKIKEGFLFDSGSIPRILWSILGHPFNYKYLYFFFVHDCFYSNWFQNEFTLKVTRKEADDKLRKDIGGVMGYIVWLGVRLFGLANFGRELEIDKKKLQKIQ